MPEIFHHGILDSGPWQIFDSFSHDAILAKLIIRLHGSILVVATSRCGSGRIMIGAKVRASGVDTIIDRVGSVLSIVGSGSHADGLRNSLLLKCSLFLPLTV